MEGIMIEFIGFDASDFFGKFAAELVALALGGGALLRSNRSLELTKAQVQMATDDEKVDSDLRHYINSVGDNISIPVRHFDRDNQSKADRVLKEINNNSDLKLLAILKRPGVKIWKKDTVSLLRNSKISLGRLIEEMKIRYDSQTGNQNKNVTKRITNLRSRLYAELFGLYEGLFGKLSAERKKILKDIIIDGNTSQRFSIACDNNSLDEET
jgi:hypothetical protein